MNFEFFAVPDYVCTGVVEHYCKVSVIISDDQLKPMAVLSVIVNKKTGGIQRQARVDKLDNAHIRTMVFGYGKNPENFCSMDQIANFYNTFDDEQKKRLRICFNNTLCSFSLAVKKGAAFTQVPGYWAMGREYLNGLADDYKSIMDGTYENKVYPPAENVQAVGQADAEPAEEAPAEPPATTPTPRVSKKVARLVFANGLTEFLNGNIYDLADDPCKVFNGKSYYAVKNERGEIRYLSEDRFQIVEQFTEPPKGE